MFSQFEHSGFYTLKTQILHMELKCKLMKRETKIIIAGFKMNASQVLQSRTGLKMPKSVICNSSDSLGFDI